MGRALEPTAVGGWGPSLHFRLPVAAEAAVVGIWMVVAVLALLACPFGVVELGPLGKKKALTLEQKAAQAQLSLRTLFSPSWGWEASAKLASSYGCAAVTTASAAC